MTTPDALEDLLRELAPQVLGIVVRRYGDFDRAEDAVQEALIAATTHWLRDGIPENPRGWLLQTAGRKLTDIHRSEQARRRRERSATSDACSTVGQTLGLTLGPRWPTPTTPSGCCSCAVIRR